MSARSPIAGWGRVPVVFAEQRLAEALDDVCRPARLTRGLGRSYGDASLPASQQDLVACSRLADRVLRFDEANGIVRAEAGLSLRDLDLLAWRRRLASPVHPGTEWVTLGGMVASDVHGKNHHRAGCFGEHVVALKMQMADGTIREVGPDLDGELFDATVGGMGLTGHILEVELRLEAIDSPWIVAETVPAEDLRQLLSTQSASSAEWPFTVSWIDGARGRSWRGLVVRGRWARADEAPARDPVPALSLGAPFDLPSGWLRPELVRLFNACYFHLGKLRGGLRVVDPRSFFFPLDRVEDWNRLYGRRGLVQHQCVIPADAGEEGVSRVLDVVARGGGSYLIVLKDCGVEGRGMLSFPKKGVSLAVDLPMRGDATRRLVDDLNEVLIGLGGRIYLAKDALTRVEHFRAMDGRRLDRWNAARRRLDPGGRLRSALSVRLLGDPA